MSHNDNTMSQHVDADESQDDLKAHLEMMQNKYQSLKDQKEIISKDIKSIPVYKHTIGRYMAEIEQLQKHVSRLQDIVNTSEMRLKGIASEMLETYDVVTRLRCEINTSDIEKLFVLLQKEGALDADGNSTGLVK